MNDKLLNNPTTFNRTEVIRALNIRKIFNAADVNWMMYFTIFIIILVISAGTLLLYNEVKKYKSNVPKLMILLLSLVLILTVMVSLHSSFSSLNAVGGSPHQWGVIRIFYLFDGIIIMAGYIMGISYEMVNIVVFGIVQPGMILFLFIFVLMKQRKRLVG